MKCYCVVLLTYDLDLWRLNPKTVSLLGYPKVITYTKFEHFGIIRFLVMLRTNIQTDKQTDKQALEKILPTPTDIVGVGNEVSVCNVIDPVTLTFDLSIQNHDTSSISQDHSIHQVWTLRNHTFLSYAADKQTDRQTNRRSRTSYPRRPIYTCSRRR